MSFLKRHRRVFLQPYGAHGFGAKGISVPGVPVCQGGHALPLTRQSGNNVSRASGISVTAQANPPCLHRSPCQLWTAPHEVGCKSDDQSSFGLFSLHRNTNQVVIGFVIFFKHFSWKNLNLWNTQWQSYHEIPMRFIGCVFGKNTKQCTPSLFRVMGVIEWKHAWNVLALGSGDPRISNPILISADICVCPAYTLNHSFSSGAIYRECCNISSLKLAGTIVPFREVL